MASNRTAKRRKATATRKAHSYRRLLCEPLESRQLLAGHAGPALEIDGVDDYATALAPDGPSGYLDLGVGATEDFTIESWFHVPDLAGEGIQTLIYKQDAYALEVSFHTGSADQLSFRVWSQELPRTLSANPTDLAVGWHHVAAVFDNEGNITPTGPQDLVAIYLDGQQVGLLSGFQLTSGVNDSSSALNVGANAGTNGFHGWIDEVRLSDAVRYTGVSYTVPSAPFSSDGTTRALWHFDEVPGSTFFEDSGPHGGGAAGLTVLSGRDGAHTGNPPGGDATAPTLLGLSPADDATGVALNTTLVMTFNENIETGAGDIVIKKSGDDSVVETIVVPSDAVSVSNSTATIDPRTTLAGNTGYYVEVAKGAFEDLAGNDFVGINGATTWNFTTNADTATIEDFETGDFTKLPWTHSGDTAWTVTSSNKRAGTYSARSGVIGDSQSTSLQGTLNTTAGDITFHRKVSSESGWDYLRFYVDGVQQGAWSGFLDWELQTYAVTAGMHEFRWTYSKDGSVSTGADAAWIDDIEFPHAIIVSPILYVDDDSTVANPDGSSWDSAFPTLEAALAFARIANGDAVPDNNVTEMRIAGGTYKPTALSDADMDGTVDTDRRSATFSLVDGVSIYGGYAGLTPLPGHTPETRNKSTYVTTLSGDLDGDDAVGIPASQLPNHPTRADNAYTVVTGIGVTVTLDGLGLTAGNANSGPYTLLPKGCGGGIYIGSASHVSLDQVSFWANSSKWAGGAIYASTSEVAISGSTITGNRADYEGGGGGVYSDSGTLTIANSTISGNVANTGGGILASGALSITGSTISGNSATTAGGGIAGFDAVEVTGSIISGNSGFYGGGIFNDGGTVIVANSTVSSNRADSEGGGIFGQFGAVLTVNASVLSHNSAANWGGGIFSSGTLRLTHSAIYENSAGSPEGGGIGGGGVFSDGMLTVTCSTISGNSALGPGGGVFSWGTATFTGATTTGNSATDGGGVYRFDGAVAVANSIFATNRATNSGPDVLGEVTSEGYNLVGDTSGSRGWVASDLLNIDPLLGPLQNNGGPTWTHALLPGSPAIDRGTNDEAPPTDERGFARIVDGDGDGTATIDIGAYELEAPYALAVTIAADSIAENLGAGATTATVTRSNADTSADLTVTLTSSDMGEARVPTIATIPAGQVTSDPFNIDTVDDVLLDGTQMVTVTASAMGYLNGSDTVDVLDNDATSTFVVNSYDDGVDANPGDGFALTASGVTTLRAAIMEANALSGENTVILPAGTYLLSIAGRGEDLAATGDLDIAGDLIIVGADANSTVVDANGLDRVFHIVGNFTFTLSGTAVRGGRARGNGGGINAKFYYTSRLIVTDCVFSNNTASYDGGGIANAGTLVVTDTTFSGNSADTYGGAIDNYGGSVTITNSTVTGNSAAWDGGGVFNSIYSTLTLTNSTFSQNHAGGLGGAICNTSSGTSSTVTVTRSTFTGNSAGSGGGIYTDRPRVTSGNTIIAGNTAATAPDICNTVSSRGNNLIGDASGSDGWLQTDLLDIGDPHLGPLHDNGGPTETHALLPDSPAIDKGNSAGAPPTDQRGFPRIVDGDGDGTTTVDIGAYEYDPPPFADFGDAPASYSTLLPAGAGHAILTGLHLGEAIDADSDGQPSAAADGDDNNGTDDEDGVEFYSYLTRGEPVSVYVTASQAGKLDAWIDFNRDGDWADPGEQVFTSESLTGGLNVLAVNVPMEAQAGDTYARFRFSSGGGLSYDGPAPDGEVEDYKVIIYDPSVINVGNHLLLPQTANQTVSVSVSGHQPVQGVTVSVQVADGYPDVPGSAIDGPDITAATVTAPDTIFGAVGNTGNNWPDQYAQYWTGGTTVSAGSIEAQGRLVTLTLNTAGFDAGAGPWELRLKDTFNGDTNFQSPYGQVFLTIVNGKLKIDSPPTVINPVLDQTVDEDAPDTVLDLSAVFADVDIAEYGDSVTLSVSSSDPDIIRTSLVGTTLTLSYPANANGESTITIRGTDHLGLYIEDTFIVAVTSVNDAPAGTDGTVTTAEDTAYTFAAEDFGFTDPNDSPANAFSRVKITTLPGAGTLKLDGVPVAAEQVVIVGDISANRLTFTPPANANGIPFATFTFQVQDEGGTAGGGLDVDPSANTLTIDVTPVADVMNRLVFYNNSTWDANNPATNVSDDNAIAPPPSIRGHGHSPALNELSKEVGKQALLPGQTASFVNYTSYTKGLNGVMIDFDRDLPTNPTLADFVFNVGNNGNPSAWLNAPEPQTISAPRDVDLGGGVLVKRVTITWADENPYTSVREPGAISNQWLQVTVLATNLGLAANDVFYFGNAIAECGNSTTETNVDQNDEIGVRNHPHTAFNPAPVYDPYDYNRDKKADQNDEILARNNPATAFNRLQLIMAPSALGGAAPRFAGAAVSGQFGTPEGESSGLTITVGDIALLPNRAGQVVPILVTGDPAVQGVVLNVQVADGYPDVPGSQSHGDGPNVTNVDLSGAGTVFGGAPYGNTGNGFPVTYPQIWIGGTTVNEDTEPGTTITVPAEGLLARLTISSVGWNMGSGPWALKLMDTFNGDVSFQTPTGQLFPELTNGRLLIKDRPTAEITRPNSVVMGGSVVLRGDGSHAWDALDTIAAYEWDLDGDGKFGETGSEAGRGDEIGVSPTFSAAGLVGGTTWDVELFVRDSNYAKNSLFVSDVVNATVVVAAMRQNPRHPCDVNGDGYINPADVLALINDLNSRGSRDLRTDSPPTPTPPPFLDPTGDGLMGPVDVLVVINYINAHGAGPIPSASGGEGEYDSPSDRDAEAIAVRSHVVGFGSDTGGSIVASTRPSRGPQAVRPASLQSTSRTVSNVTRPWTVHDTLLGDGLEASELEEAITAIAEAVAHAWDSQLRA